MTGWVLALLAAFGCAGLGLICSNVVATRQQAAVVLASDAKCWQTSSRTTVVVGPGPLADLLAGRFFRAAFSGPTILQFALDFESPASP
jgi:hypothetical protein